MKAANINLIGLTGTTRLDKETKGTGLTTVQVRQSA